jgi:hypothetical protein
MPAVHAPTEDEDGFIKEEFYQELNKVYDSLAISATKIMLGDLNAKVGKEMSHRGTTGVHNLHYVSNVSGCKLIDFAISKNMVIMSTCFPYKEIHKTTWPSPDGIVFNQIDHILVDRKFASSILDVRSIPWHQL